MSVFKDYDIRGVYPKELDERFAFKLGRVYASVFKAKKVIVGQDMRLSSSSLANEFIHGLLVSGVDVVDMGLCSTPMLYYAGRDADAIMITASHNPPEYNGFKICRNGVAIGYATGISKLEYSMSKKNYPSKEPGKLNKKNFLPSYINHVLRFAGKIRHSRIVVDAGNGMAGLVAPELFKRLNVELKPLFFDLDGNFPNRSPNPIAENALVKLGNHVKKTSADAGLAYDGDCDRLVMVDEKGKPLRTDSLASLLISKLPRKSKVVITPFASRSIIQAIKDNDCKAVMSRVGHTNVSITMKRSKAIFGTERSGHYFFKDNFYLDSGDIAAVKALSIIGKERLSEQAMDFERTFVFEKTLPISKGKKFLKKLRSLDASHLSIDGERVDFEYGWLCARASNTEPVVRVVGEAYDKSGLKQLKSI